MTLSLELGWEQFVAASTSKEILGNTIPIDGCRFDDTLLIARGALDRPRVVACRHDPRIGSFSGWYVGSADGGPLHERDDLEWTYAYEVLRRRRALVGVLSHGRGFTFTFDGEKVADLKPPKPRARRDERDPESLVEVADLAGRAAAARSFREARRLYEKAIACEPGNFAGFYFKAQFLLFEARRPDEALAYYQQALARHEDKGAVLGEALARVVLNRDVDRALAAFDRALVVDPDHPAPLVAKEWALKKLGRTAEARACRERALRLDPGGKTVRQVESIVSVLDRGR